MIMGLAACGGGGGGGGFTGPVFDPNVAPQNAQVVAGTGGISGPQNTVSWNRAVAATDYVVYWDDVPGITANSNVLVPVPASSNQLTHVGLTAGVSYYYRVEARSGSQTSVLSVEVVGTPQSAITVQNLLDVAWNGTDTLVAVGNSGVIINSPNGTTNGWSFAAVNPVENTAVTLAGVTWDVDGARFLAVGGGGSVLTSADGDTWITQNSQVNIDLEAVVWTGSQFVAVGGSATILTSPDGVTWAQQVVPPVVTGTLRGVTASGNLIVAVGNNGAILTSPDGMNWIARPSGTNSSLEDVAWTGSQFVVAGVSDTILTSTDGIAWGASSLGTSGNSYFGTTYWPSPLLPAPLLVAGGSSGTIVTSSNPAGSWVTLPSGTDKQLNGVTWLDEPALTHFIMVGNEGTLLTNAR